MFFRKKPNQQKVSSSSINFIKKTSDGFAVFEKDGKEFQISQNSEFYKKHSKK